MTKRPDLTTAKALPILFNDELMRDFGFSFDGGQDFHRAQLFRLLRKADPQNIEKHRLGFPVEVQIVEAWKMGRLTEKRRGDWKYE